MTTKQPDKQHDATHGPSEPDSEHPDSGDYGAFEPALPLDVTIPKRLRLSFSRIDTYQNCGLKFRYAYIDKLPTKPAPQLSFGKSIHAALEAFYDRKLPEPPPVDVLIDALYQQWDTSGFQELPRDEQLAYYRHAQDVVRRFYERNVETFRLPVATEQWFDMPMGQSVSVVGSIDRVDSDEAGGLHVIDYKTNRKAKTYRDVARSLQLSIYALACKHLYGRLPQTVSLDFVIPGVRVTVPTDELDLDAATDAVAHAATAIRSESFDANPNPLCNWCDFQALCPAWDGPDGESLAELKLQLTADRRRLQREVSEYRLREQAVERMHQALFDTENGT